MFGGSGWSRTNNVYPVGSDLQSEDAHAIASTLPRLYYYTINSKIIQDNILASWKGLEPLQAVLETAVLPITLPR
jgi:hypothetical protein